MYAPTLDTVYHQRLLHRLDDLSGCCMSGCRLTCPGFSFRCSKLPIFFHMPCKRLCHHKPLAQTSPHSQIKLSV